MSEDWNSVTRIGSKVRAGGGTVTDRERVVKGKSALNAAQRSGAIIGTEKKFGTANSAGQGEGQHLTKVDRADGPVPVKTVGLEVGKAIAERRQKMNPPLNREQLATKVSLGPSVVAAYENGTAKPEQKHLISLEKVLGIKLRGNNIGGSLFGPKKEKA
ncbi:multiprotein-bridging factor 1 [Exophiala xenobiotica]|uniref:Multiprotein-bridging factor 1 n=1 Tax=Lithohypha guttulata TaxID=1690604 RepID=A0ABR0KKP2_9EURO|nr:multiprotein-bridging factor 1 [Lithohypha guttulata]KAK5309800.1 multiprotein-bridging factor 1 [Exophiala xenobiotica]